MESVTVKTQDLKEILRNNRKQHRAIFIEAQKKFREKVMKLLDWELKRMREGGDYKAETFTRLVVPIDQTKDYDVAIGMLDMEVNRTIALSTQEYQCYVLDEWGWSHMWATANSHYVESDNLKKHLS